MLDAMVARSAELLRVPDTSSIRGDLVTLGRQLVEYASSPLGEALIRTMASSPVHFRLLLTREPVDTVFLETLADVTVQGITAAQPA